uniref:Phytanoyl-CoA dioxygenase n=1 Tax=Odontella aurita TaxID=265563 RepID=A0A7S4JAC9_9STRA|mmetsp:Transcript_42138/g.127840  ORF Transcript_42138/g.127840 Transcript_42138/m.127840 type:complete len:319 (+) Transcript_42138:91-1047(+)
MNAVSESDHATPRDAGGPDENHRSYLFDIDDVRWLPHLRERGYAVLTNVLTPDDVATAKNLLWEDICGAYGVSCDNPSTLSKLSLPFHGIVASMAQTAGTWHIRGNANVHEAFSTIWDTSDLIASMDAIILWRSDSHHDTEGLHLDQNPFKKPYLDCIQGMVPLLPVTSDVGGLRVVPFSHTEEARTRFCERFPEYKYRGDFLYVDEDPLKPAVLLECGPGDLILWDSRTVHGGTVGPGVGPQSEQTPRICRMAITVALTPRAKASQKVLQLRRKGFENGISFNHCPHEAGTSTGTIQAKRKKGCKKFDLTESQLKVL